MEKSRKSASSGLLELYGHDTGQPAAPPSLYERFFGKHDPSQTSDPRAPFGQFLPGGAHAGAPGALMDLLSRPGQATQRAMLHGPGEGVNTLVHGESPEDQQRIRDEFKARLGLTGASNALPPGIARGALDTTIDTLADPTTYLGGAGVFEHLAGQAGRHALPAAIRATAATAKAAERIPRVGSAVAGAVRGVGDVAGAGHDFFTWKGGVKRALAERSGAQGVDQFHALTAARSAGESQAQALENALSQRYQTSIKGLKPEDERRVYAALNRGTEAKLPKRLQQTARDISDLTDTVAYLSGTKALQKKLVKDGFTLPEWAHPFDNPQARGLMRTSQYRKSYVPLIHKPEQFANLDELDRHYAAGGDPYLNEQNLLERQRVDDATRKTKGLLDERDPFLRQREEAERIMYDPEAMRESFNARFRSGARAISGRDTIRRAASTMGTRPSQVPRFLSDLFRDEFTEKASLGSGKGIAEGIRRVADAPKYGFFFNPAPHMGNIATLGTLASPTSVARSLPLFGKLLKANPEERYAMLRDVAHGGALTVDKLDKDVPGWIGKIPGVGAVYRASNKVLWSFDDAVKATRFRELVGRGMKESDAAARVGAELIDYGHRSPFTKALGYVAPFATFRSKMPAAVLGSVARHPERALIANRASGGFLTGSDVEGSEGGKATSYSPLAEALRMFDKPQDYVRSTLSYPYKDLFASLGLGALGAQHLSLDPEQREKTIAPHYLLGYNREEGRYNNVGDVILSQLLGPFPGGEQLLTAIHKNPYAGRNPFRDFLESALRMRVYDTP